MPWCRAAGVINDAQCSPVSRHRASIKGSQLLTDARRAAPGCARGLTWLGEARLLLPSACLLPLRLPCSVVCALIVVAPPPPQHGERMGQRWACTTHTAHHGGALAGQAGEKLPLLSESRRSASPEAPRSPFAFARARTCGCFHRAGRRPMCFDGPLSRACRIKQRGINGAPRSSPFTGPGGSIRQPAQRPTHTGAGGDHGIDHDQTWLRFPYDSTALRPHYLHPHPYACMRAACTPCHRYRYAENTRGRRGRGAMCAHARRRGRNDGGESPEAAPPPSASRRLRECCYRYRE
eukprot:COSAG01_NODE_1363_length_10560_cov_2530.174773_2_plen_293_part_00